MNLEKKFWDALCSRRSVRAFSDENVDDAVIKKVLSAAFVAPRGTQEKSWDFIIIKNHDFKIKLKEIIENKIEQLSKKINAERLAKIFKSYGSFFTFFTKAPVVIVALEKEHNSILVKILSPIETRDYMDNITMVSRQNVAAAIQNVLLACECEGLGACWMTGPMIAQDELRKELNLKDGEKVAALIPIGYPSIKIQPHKLPTENELNFKII